MNDFFEVGNPVLVRYKSDNAGNHALDIERVGSPGSAEPPEPHEARRRKGHVGDGYSRDSRG